MRFVYSEDHIQFLRDNFPKMALEDLTAAFNSAFDLDKSVGSIRSALKNHRITCGRKQGQLVKGKPKLVTWEQKQWLIDQYQGMTQAELLQAFNTEFNRTLGANQLRAFLKNHKIRSGRTGYFEKGQQPWNTGTKGVMKPNSGCFKPGQEARNRRPLYSERIDTKDGFILIKVPERCPHTGRPTRFKHKHVWIWEQVHGPVPEGMCVSFIDGDKLHCELENLELVTRGELAIRNKLQLNRQPEELKPAIKALAKLRVKANELEASR